MTDIVLWMEEEKVWYCLDIWMHTEESLALRLELMEMIE